MNAVPAASETHTQRAIRLGGGAAKVAEHFGIGRLSVYEWVAKDRVPAERCPSLEKLIGSQVRCEDLRPDVDWAYLRSTAPAPTQQQEASQ